MNAKRKQGGLIITNSKPDAQHHDKTRLHESVHPLYILDSSIHNVYTYAEVIVMMNATIKTWGNSQGIRLSKNVLKTANMDAGEIVEVETLKNEIIIRKVKRLSSLEELFADYNGDYRPSEHSFGEDVGLEVIV